MFRKLFGSSHSFTIDQEIPKRKSAIHVSAANDGDKDFKKSIRNVIKTSIDLQKIRAAIEQNEFISHIITGKRLQSISLTIYSHEVRAGEIIIQEGEIGSQLFISNEGRYEVTTKSGVHFKFDDIRVFGELALLYNEKRKATIKALTKGKLWVLENTAFKEIIKRSEEEERKETVSFLIKVPVLNTAPEEILGFVADLLISKYFPTNHEIIREGDIGDAFYIIRAGTVRVKTKKEGTVAILGKGQFFGELALLHEDVRKATVQVESPGCECLILSRQHFIKHFGNVEDFRKVSISNQFNQMTIQEEQDFDKLMLEDFKRIKTIGVGGFGRVDLVQHKTDEKSIFALKYLKKYKCELQEQRDHVLNEKNIQMSCYCPFIIRLYKTFKDSRYLYFLLEAQLGGDLWRLLYYVRGKPFCENDAKFYVGCVVEAFQYLHERGIVYRDLKPENLLISKNGYIKLTDFGFAKVLNKSKTHSLVGTPDYMPPEIVLNNSHDRAADCWTIGIFIYELITLKTPFKACCDHDTYSLILGGIEHCKFPQIISSKAKHLIMKLCKNRPSDRLGYSKNGEKDIKNHPWFAKYDWECLQKLKIRPPYIPKLESSLDLSNFSIYKEDSDMIPEVDTDWDVDF